MKKLAVGSFAFVFALVLSTSVFAQNYDITEFCGENGLINRGQSEPFATGDVLNVKNDITQEPDETGYLDENNVLGGYYDSRREITINGNGHTINGGGYDGFKMTAYNSGEGGREATIKNATLTNFSKKNYYVDVISIQGAYNSANEPVKLTLKDVNIVNNNAGINIGSYGQLDINSSNNVKISSNAGGFNIESNATVNFKGNKTTVKDTNIKGSGNINVKATLDLDTGDNSGFSGNLTVENGTINLLPEGSYFGGNTHNFYKNGTLNLANNYIDDAVVLDDLEISGTMKLNVDVDLAEEAIDDVQFGDVYPEQGQMAAAQEPASIKISLNKINLLSDANSKVTVCEFGKNAEDFIKVASSQKELLGPVFTYKVSYGEQDKNSVGNSSGTAVSSGTTNLLQFERLGGGDGEVNLQTGEKIEGPLNPVFLQSKVAIAASSISQEEVFDTVLNNAGNYTFFQKQGSNAGDVEDRAAPTLWIKAFGSQEDVDMEDYTKVKTTYYGAVVGLDWDRQYTDNFDATYGIFASYIGGEFKDEDWSEGDFKVKQNGGYVGLRGNWYVGKLFINGIVDYGMLQNTADNPYDSNDFNSSVIGLAARVGYNFEVARRRFTIQPSVGATGKYILSDDFETKLKDERKIKEEIDNITNITIEPGLKLALNLGKCWILTGEGKYVVENFSGDTKVKGEEFDFILPDVSYKNYANCGLGIEKIWGYTVLHVKGNKTFGGRDGFIINAGIEFKF